jgi:hypothetical protein
LCQFLICTFRKSIRTFIFQNLYHGRPIPKICSFEKVVDNLSYVVITAEFQVSEFVHSKL